MIRRYGSPPVNGKRYRRRPGAYAILPRNGQVLLTWQGGIHNELQLPGGGIDPGEGAIAALHREVFEETGWRIANPVRLGTFRRFAYMPEYDMWAEKVAHIFVARPVTRLGPPVEAEHTAIWAEPDVAADLIAGAGDAGMVRRYFGLSAK